MNATPSGSTAGNENTSAPTAEMLPVIGSKAHGHAAGLSRAERALILKQCAEPWDGITNATLWGDGKFDTTEGKAAWGTWQNFAGMMSDNAERVVDKGEGLWFTPALSSNGGCRDADIVAITQLAHDCDGAGDWFVLREVLDAAGLAYIVQRSSSHKPEKPKWHLHIPLSEPWQGTKTEWRAIYRHCVGWFSAAAELAHDLQAQPIRYGFDHATDRLGQPWFPAARRTETDPAPATICVPGDALDLHAFLEATGFDPALAEQEALAATPARKQRSPKTGVYTPVVGDVGPAGGLLKRAFRHAGWLGPEMEEGKAKVQCPWEDQHTTGSRFDSSTILFSARPGDEVGWFHCKHSHCCDRQQQEVLDALPDEALEQARAELRAAKIWQHMIRTPEFNASLGSNNNNPARDVSANVEAQKFPLTDMGNAERLYALRGTDIGYCFASGTWMSWDDKRWATGNSGEVVEYAKMAVRSIYKEAGDCENFEERQSLVAHAKRSEKVERVMAIEKLARSMVPVLPEMLDTDPWLLNVDNGTLDLRTGQLRPHRREDRITKLTPITYDPAATCPLWEAFLACIFDKNKNLIDFVQRLFGYSLTGEVSEQALVFLYGTGANGKSTFLLILQALLGEYATQAAPELLLTKKGDAHPTEVADLFGRRVAVSTEVEAGRSWSEVQIKQLTGGDRIKARFMRKDFFEFQPTHKLFVAANHKPKVRGTDHGIWRRIRLVPFCVTIPEHARDKNLVKKLQAELPGILAWAVRGCLAWQKDGLGEPEEVKAATEAYREEMDTLGEFFADCCIVGPKVEAKAQDLYGAYTKWCETNGERPMGHRLFGMALRERGFKDRKSGVKLWVGVGLAGAPVSPMVMQGTKFGSREDRDDEGRRNGNDAFTTSHKGSSPDPGPNPPFRPIRAPDPAAPLPANDPVNHPTTGSPPPHPHPVQTAPGPVYARRHAHDERHAQQRQAEERTDEALEWHFRQMRAEGAFAR
ncbi:DNA primase family protein [Polyangium mundeleinium]|uniref:Phage/plasmid primase, P4 family n=1 Tax=Polyangium mundeleinium TaxID=2995306 RepID=A0ABT5EMW1_9BACT|nr:phage/plasmid primase, P4 family [Polyangium mundeleinium]MDC0743168.1 phage/plasmid primase, P4 family [Polyangium mundeleinium]